MMSTSHHVLLVAILAGLALPAFAGEDGDAEKPTPSRRSRDALAQFNMLIGEWDGVGVFKDSSRGNWTEEAQWRWDFGDDSVALLFQLEKSKLFKKARLTYSPVKKTYHLKATGLDENVRQYAGRRQGKHLLLTSQPDDGHVFRMRIAPLNPKRTVILHQKRPKDKSFYQPLAQVGYTRSGTSLADGDAYPKCIVTGGRGTMKVTYKGTTYYVCCKGCRQAFEENPEEFLAAAEKREEDEKAE